MEKMPVSEHKENRLTLHKRLSQAVFHGCGGGICPPAGGAVARSNSPPGCSLCRALQIPPRGGAKKEALIRALLLLLSRGAEKDVLKKYLLICSLKFHSCPVMTEYE